MHAPEALAAELDRLLATAQAEQRMPSVSACVFRDGEVIWERVLGVADVASARAATSDDVYRIGSITKTFTAVLIMQLVHAGRIDLEAPLRTYLPEAPVGPTVRMALSHMTGVQREPPGEIWESMQPPSREELIAGLEDAELVLRPGEQWHYSNLVFALLGEIVMRVTGESYADVLQQRILDPLGLTRTSLRPGRTEGEPVLRRSVRRHGARRAGSGGDGVDGGGRVAVVDAGRPRPLGSVPRRRPRRRAPEGGARPDGAPADDGRRGEVEPRLGPRARALPARRPRLRRPRRRDAGLPGRARRPAARSAPGPPCSRTRVRARARRLLRSTSPSLRSTRCRARRSSWEPAAAIPPELEGVLGLWWTEGEEIVLAMREGRFQATLVGGAAGAQHLVVRARRPRPLARRRRTRARRAAPRPCGPRTARSRSSTSRRTRSRASRRRSVDRYERSPATKNIAATPT